MLTTGSIPGLFASFDFKPNSTLVAAVSGGSDSTALLFLLKNHLETLHPSVRLIAATVDHDLREGSATEAAAVGVLCRAHRIEHRILSWTGSKPRQGIQAAARLARHKLLADLASAEGAEAVFTGHSRDDQVETVLMRKARGEGYGTAGMAPATLFEGRTWFCRPLLNTSRAELRNFLLSQRINWIEDPSNHDTRFERVRLRAELAGAADREEQAAGAMNMATKAARQRIEIGKQAADMIERHAVLAAPGLMRLDRSILSEADEDAARHVFRILLAAVGGADHLPNLERASALFERLRLAPLRANLSRTLVDARSKGIFLLREQRGLAALPQPKAGELWDRRYRIVAGRQVERGDSSRAENAPESLIRKARQARPRLSIGLSAEPVVPPWSVFLPSFDLAPARAVAKLLGARQFPEPVMSSSH